MNERTARCACGQLKVQTAGEPEMVALCCCGQCQSRTGSAFSVHAFFPHDQARIDGASKTFTRSADSGRNVTFHFCPDCGSTVYWQTEVRPHSWGMAVGAFQEPNFPAPERAIWAEKKFSWMSLPEGIPVLSRGSRPVPQTPS